MKPKRQSFETALLKADFKRLEENIAEFKTFLREHSREDKRNFDKVVRNLTLEFKSQERRLVHLEKQLDMWAFGINIVKFTVAFIVAILTFKFGDVSRLWTSLVGGH